MSDSSSNGVLLVINPKGGSCDAMAIQVLFEKAARERGARFRIYETTGDDDFALVVREAASEGFSVVAACGGDGTVSAVATHLVGTSLRLGILPAGTANVLAKELGVPFDRPAAVASFFDDSSVRRIDAMRVNGRCFFSHLSIGVYSQIAENTPPKLKKRFGRLAYVWQCLKLLHHPNAWRFRIDCDGVRRRVVASTILVVNAGSMGAMGLKWAPGVTADDGKLAVCVIRANFVLEYLSVMLAFLRTKHRESKYISLFSVQRMVRVENRHGIPVRGDGEIVGHDTVEIEVLPYAVAVIAPAAAPAERRLFNDQRKSP